MNETKSNYDRIAILEMGSKYSDELDSEIVRSMEKKLNRQIVVVPPECSLKIIDSYCVEEEISDVASSHGFTSTNITKVKIVFPSLEEMKKYLKEKREERNE